MSVVIELPPQRNQIAFNEKRWGEIMSDSEIAELEQRIETDRFGHVIMSPCAGGWHGAMEGDLCFRLRSLLGGMSVAECPISTSDGVKLADVGWYSADRFEKVKESLAFPIAPEICIEVLSPSNTPAEMEMKRRLYHEAGCLEFWTCDQSGTVLFLDAENGKALSQSRICPDFPDSISI